MVSICGCGNGASSNENSLTVFNCSQYMDPTVADQFTEETGIVINYEEALTPEDMYSKFSSDVIDYDLLCTSDYMLERLIKEDRVQKVDFSTFKYGKNIGQKYWNLCQAFDANNEYCIPYFWGMLGILYNKTKVEGGKIDSWDALFNGKYNGQVIMQDSMRDSYMVALKYLGYSLNTTNEAEIKAAQDLLIKQKPQVQAYLVDESRDEIVAGNAAMAVIYSGEAHIGMEANKDLDYVTPKEGSNLWIDCWVIPKNSKKAENAKKFLDFLCREDIAMKNFKFDYYSTPNEAVLAALSDTEKKDPTIVPDEATVAKCEVSRMLDDKTSELMNKFWVDLKAQ